MQFQSPLAMKGPFFAKGVLTYEEPGHTLTQDKAYYVCSLRQKGKCDLHRKTIKKETLERSFMRFAKKFEIPDEQKHRVGLQKITRDVMHAVIDDMIDAPESMTLDYALDVAQQSAAAKDMKQFAEDIMDVEEGMKKRLLETTISTVVTITLATVMTFGKEKVSEAEMGRSLSYLSRKIILTAEGKLQKIELFTLGDYTFQLIKKHYPAYAIPTKMLGEPFNFSSLDFAEVAKQIRKKDLVGMIPHDGFADSFRLVRSVRFFMGLVGRPDKESAIAALKLLTFNPIFAIGGLAQRIVKPK